MALENLPFLLADTVGFIHKLPHCLVESFKATLDEVREADLLLHVIDLSHPDYHDQMQVVHEHRISQAVDGENRSQKLQSCPNPLPPMLERLAGQRIIPAQEGSSHTALHAMHDLQLAGI